MGGFGASILGAIDDFFCRFVETHDLFDRNQQDGLNAGVDFGNDDFVLSDYDAAISLVTAKDVLAWTSDDVPQPAHGNLIDLFTDLSAVSDSPVVPIDYHQDWAFA